MRITSFFVAYQLFIYKNILRIYNLKMSVANSNSISLISLLLAPSLIASRGQFMARAKLINGYSIEWTGPLEMYKNLEKNTLIYVIGIGIIIDICIWHIYFYLFTIFESVMFRNAYFDPLCCAKVIESTTTRFSHIFCLEANRTGGSHWSQNWPNGSPSRLYTISDIA